MRRLKFLLVPRLSLSRCFERPLLDFLFFLFLSTMFLWGTRGYVRQRRVITLTRPEGSPEESPRDFCPERGIPGLIEERKNARRSQCIARPSDSSSQNLIKKEKKKRYPGDQRRDFGIGTRLKASLISYYVCKSENNARPRNVTARLSLSPLDTHAHTLFFFYFSLINNSPKPSRYICQLDVFTSIFPTFRTQNI